MVLSLLSLLGSNNHLDIDHNAPCLRQNFVLPLSSISNGTTENLETMIMQNCGGQTRFIMVYVKMVN